MNPRRSRPADLEDIGRSLHLMEQAVAEALSLARTVATSADRANVWEDSFRSEWQRLLTATAEALDAGDPERLDGIRKELGELAGRLSTDGLAGSSWQEYGGVMVNLRNILDAGVELARWTSEATTTPRRRRRYDVPTPVRKPDPRD